MTYARVIPEAGLSVTIGRFGRDELLAELGSHGILLNTYAETLLADAVFESADGPRAITVVERSVKDLGLPDGAPLSQIFMTAEAQGLRLCPPTTGPYLRLAVLEQPSAPDSVLNAGRAPSESLTIATPAFQNDDDFPKGFYLRVVDGEAWLRGYRCDDEHIWSPGDRFAFRRPSSP